MGLFYFQSPWHLVRNSRFPRGLATTRDCQTSRLSIKAWIFPPVLRPFFLLFPHHLQRHYHPPIPLTSPIHEYFISETCHLSSEASHPNNLIFSTIPLHFVVEYHFFTFRRSKTQIQFLDSPHQWQVFRSHLLDSRMTNFLHLSLHNRYISIFETRTAASKIFPERYTRRDYFGRVPSNSIDPYRKQNKKILP